MTEGAAQMVREIVQMREQYFAEVGKDARRAWPKSIRERIMALDAMGVSRKEIASLTGVPYETIVQWRHYQKKIVRRRFHTLQVRPQDATVTVASTVNSNSSKPVSVTVTTPDGYRIEGVVSDVLSILNGLRVP